MQRAVRVCAVGLLALWCGVQAATILAPEASAGLFVRTTPAWVGPLEFNFPNISVQFYTKATLGSGCEMPLPVAPTELPQALFVRSSGCYPEEMAAAAEAAGFAAVITTERKIDVGAEPIVIWKENTANIPVVYVSSFDRGVTGANRFTRLDLTPDSNEYYEASTSALSYCVLILPVIFIQIAIFYFAIRRFISYGLPFQFDFPRIVLTIEVISALMKFIAYTVDPNGLRHRMPFPVTRTLLEAPVLGLIVTFLLANRLQNALDAVASRGQLRRRIRFLSVAAFVTAFIVVDLIIMIRNIERNGSGDILRQSLGINYSVCQGLLGLYFVYVRYSVVKALSWRDIEKSKQEKADKKAAKASAASSSTPLTTMEKAQKFFLCQWAKRSSSGESDAESGTEDEKAIAEKRKVFKRFQRLFKKEGEAGLTEFQKSLLYLSLSIFCRIGFILFSSLFSADWGTQVWGYLTCFAYTSIFSSLISLFQVLSIVPKAAPAPEDEKKLEDNSGESSVKKTPSQGNLSLGRKLPSFFKKAEASGGDSGPLGKEGQGIPAGKTEQAAAVQV